jgi:hypothetical protein
MAVGRQVPRSTIAEVYDEMVAFQAAPMSPVSPLSHNADAPVQVPTYHQNHASIEIPSGLPEPSMNLLLSQQMSTEEPCVVNQHQAPSPTAVEPALTTRPYSYNAGFDALSYHARQFQQEIQMLTQLTEESNLTDSPCLKTLARLDPYNFEAFKYEFHLATGKDLHDFCMTLAAKQRSEVKTYIAGITLCPAEFDYYLIKNGVHGRKMDDTLIHIFIGKDQGDIKYLDSLWQQHEHSPLTSAIPSLTHDKTLQYALRTCITHGDRDDPSKPIDRTLISRDVKRLEELLRMSFASIIHGLYASDFPLLDTLLPRNDRYIQQLALAFQTATGCNLEDKIRKSRLDEITKRIGVHALRMATDPTYHRDCLAWKNASPPGRGREELAVRVSRGHWYGHHWKDLQAIWGGLFHADFKDRVRYDA